MKPPAGGKSRWLDYARSEISGIRKWVRRSASKDNLVQGIKTFAWVGPLTLLIWIYAEREQEYKSPPVVISYEVRSSDPNRVITLTHPNGGDSIDPRSVVDTGEPSAPRREFSDNAGQVTVELIGPKAAVQKVLQAFDGVRVKLEIDRGAPIVRQSNGFNLANLLNNLPLLHDNGVAVASTNPAQVQAYIDEVVEEEREVAVANNVINLVGNPTFDPPKVVLRGPRRDVEAAGPQLQAFADLAPFAKNAGEQTQVPVTIRQPSNGRLEFKPTSVHATFVVRESDVTGTIRQMPVWPCAAPGLADKYKWDIADNGQIYNVKVTGPPDVIAALEKEQIKPRAIVFLTREDVVNSLGTPKQFPVRLDLPENVHGAGDDPKRTVSITVNERTGTDG